jgi:transcriptional regulator of arginine metabolism
MKNKRQLKILELVRNNEIETQGGLMQMLLDEGFNVTQATVSRDIRELNLIKVQLASGTQKYDCLKQIEDFDSNKFIRNFRESVDTIDFSGNMIILRTLPGMASAVAACIDGLGISELLGSLAGDNTIFAVVRETASTAEVADKLRGIVGK